MASPVDRFNAHTAKRAVGKLPHHRVARALATSVLGFIGVLVWLVVIRIPDKDLRDEVEIGGGCPRHRRPHQRAILGGEFLPVFGEAVPPI